MINLTFAIDQFARTELVGRPEGGSVEEDAVNSVNGLTQVVEPTSAMGGS